MTIGRKRKRTRSGRPRTDPERRKRSPNGEAEIQQFQENYVPFEGNIHEKMSIPHSQEADSGSESMEMDDRSARVESGSDLIRLDQVSSEERELQARYFRIPDPNAEIHCYSCGRIGYQPHNRCISCGEPGESPLIRCLNCGGEGHLPDTCTANTCPHCGIANKHTARACPAFRKCGRCRQRGHTSSRCSRSSRPAGGPSDPCDVCGRTGHAEEECADLYRSWMPTESNVKKIPRWKMRKACYNCASNKHWGDDCPSLPKSKRHFTGSYSVWSAAYADRFIEESETTRDQRSTKQSNARHYQLNAFDDTRD